MSEQSFREQAKQDGYADPVVMEYEAGAVRDTHTHDFAARLFILSGEITVRTPDRETTCRTGDSGSVAQGEPHSEHTGPEGVRFLVARKQGS